ncbi:MAG: response regulator [Gammaproteobacteria bacterium]|nr:response regulator [Gammaproteobacteria bacterium]
MNPDVTADVTPNLDYSRHVLIEFSELLGRLRQLTMNAVEQGSDRDALKRLEECVTQAHHTFELIECAGAELVCDELLALLDAVQRGTVDTGFNTAPVMVLAGEKLSEYIDYLLSGGPDLPLALLPLVNNMRACRGVGLLSEALIVAPHFSVPSTTRISRDALDLRRLPEVDALRLSLMKHLLQWFSAPGQRTSTALAADFSRLQQLFPDAELEQLFGAAAALAVSLADGGLESSPAIKLLLGQLERYVNALNQYVGVDPDAALTAVVDLAEEQTERATEDDINPKGIDEGSIVFPASLFRNLLYYLALSESADPRVVALKKGYRLPELLPPKASLDLARTALGGPEASLSGAICSSVSKELNEVRANLDSCSSLDVPVLRQAQQQLRQISYTLLLLDLHAARRLTQRAVNRIGLAEKTGDIRLLLAVASDLLQVFQSLDEYQHGKRQTVIFADDFETLAGSGGRLSGYQYNLIVDKCLAEAVATIQAVQQDFLQVQEDFSRRSQLEVAAQRLRVAANALQILPLPEIRPLLDGAADYLLHVVELPSFPPPVLAQAFARLLVSIELYLDPDLQRQPAAAQLLLLADSALDDLQESDADYFADDAPVQTGNANSTDNLQRVSEDAYLGDAQINGAQASDVQTSDEQISDAQLPAFINEALERLDAIHQAQADWKRTDKVKHLLELQDNYVALSSSARRVKAHTLSRLSGSVAGLLDGVLLSEVGETPQDQLDASVMMRPADSEKLSQVLDESVALLPQLINLLPAQGDHLTGLTELLEQLEPVVGDSSDSREWSEDQTQVIVPVDVHDQTEGILETDSTLVLTSATAQYHESDWLEKTVAIESPGVTAEALTATEEPLDQTTDLTAEATQFIASEITEGSEAAESLDNTLMKVFFGECQTHIRLLKSDIAKALRDTPSQLPTSQMQRSLHTLHGSAQTAEVPPVINLVAPLDRIATQRLAANRPLNRAETSLLDDAVSVIEQIIDALSTGSEMPAISDLQQQLESLANAWIDDGEDSDSSVTADLQGLFVEEAGEILTEVHQDVSTIRDSSDHLEPLARIAGALHTLKGSARVARFFAISDLTHALETALVDWNHDLPLSAARQDLLQQVIDAITLNLEQAQAGAVMGQFDWLITELDSDSAALDATVAVSTDIVEEAIASTNRPVTDTEPDSVALVEGEVDDTMVVSTPFTHQRAASPSDKALSVSGSTPLHEGEQIKLDTSSISRLSDLSTEASIQQARVHEQFHALRQSLVDLDKTTDRLRYKLRELQKDGDVTLSRSVELEQGDSDSDATTRFDPQELERYTQSREDARQLGELLADFDAIRSSLQAKLSDAEEESALASRLQTDIQQSLMRSRLVRFGQHSDRLGSVVRQTATALGKQVDWKLVGGEIEVDRTLKKTLIGPLEHLVRNAISHGIESPEQRLADEKPPVGTVTIEVRFEGTTLVIVVSDDGAGIDVERLREKLAAADVGLVAEQIANMSDEQLFEQLFEAGFSTAESADQYSGRGVGLDVVARAVAELDGQVRISSRDGQGSALTIRIPQRVVINQVVLVQVQDVVAGIPVDSVHTVQPVDSDQVVFGDATYDACPLAGLLQLKGRSKPGNRSNPQAVLIEAAGRHLALEVDDVPGYRELIARPLGRQISTLDRYIGGAVLPDGRSVLILNLDSVVEHGFEQLSAPDNLATTPPASGPGNILVVDDSVTMRSYAGRMLKQQGCEVTFARDGLEALDSLAENLPDLILLDVEMPRMNGFDFLTAIRSEPAYQGLSVVMTTSRAASRHRRRASELGAEGYLVKPYRESELLRLLKKLTGDVKPEPPRPVN